MFSQKILQTWIGAPTKEEARKICKLLIDKKLISGAFIIQGESFYWWDNKVHNNEVDFNIIAYCLEKNKQKIIDEVEIIHSYNTPLIVFKSVEVNKKSLDWINKVCK